MSSIIRRMFLQVSCPLILFSDDLQLLSIAWTWSSVINVRGLNRVFLDIFLPQFSKQQDEWKDVFWSHKKPLYPFGDTVEFKISALKIKHKITRISKEIIYFFFSGEFLGHFSEIWPKKGKAYQPLNMMAIGNYTNDKEQVTHAGYSCFGLRANDVSPPPRNTFSIYVCIDIKIHFVNIRADVSA